MTKVKVRVTCTGYIGPEKSISIRLFFLVYKIQWRRNLRNLNIIRLYKCISVLFRCRDNGTNRCMISFATLALSTCSQRYIRFHGLFDRGTQVPTASNWLIKSYIDLLSVAIDLINRYGITLRINYKNFKKRFVVFYDTLRMKYPKIQKGFVVFHDTLRM